ncbi:MAG: hypothetical protein ACK5S6_00195, partial [bacterium]
MRALLAKESKSGVFLFIVDGTQKTQAGKKSENAYACSAGNLGRYKNKRNENRNRLKTDPKSIHSSTWGLLITPSGIRIPCQMPHYTEEYSQLRNVPMQTTAECAAAMIRSLNLPKGAEVIVLGDTAYESEVVRKACEEKGYTWIFPANAERVYEGTKGNRPQLRSRLKDWT